VTHQRALARRVMARTRRASFVPRGGSLDRCGPDQAGPDRHGRIARVACRPDLGVMNAGGRLDDAIHGVVPPRRLLDRPYLRPVYDEPEFIVHTVWRLYGGWWDGNPASLKPALERALAAELAAVAGGAQALADRALALLAEVRSSAGAARIEEALRLAGHLAELAWLAAPGTRGSGECGRRSIRPGQRRRPRRWPRECSGGRARQPRRRPPAAAGSRRRRAKPPPSASPTRTRSAAPARRGC